jgi:hypothetical protein
MNHHASDADAIRSAAESALHDVDTLEITEPLDRAVLLGGIFLARLGIVGMPTVPMQNAHQPGDARNQLGFTPPRGEGDLIGKIAARLQLDRNVVDQVYRVTDDTVNVIVSPRRLSPSKATATRQLAQLVAGGRQAADIEEWTDAGIIRQVVSDFGRYDSPNFASTIASMDEVFLFSGKGQSRTVKVSRPGMETISALVRNLAEGAS